MRPRPQPPTQTRRVRLLLVVMVIVGYVINFVFISLDAERRLTPEELLGGSLLG